MSELKVRLDENLKKDSMLLLEGIGLTLSDYVRMSLVQLNRQKQVPFELIPNEETILAMKEIEEGRAKSFNSIEELMKDLNS